MAPSALPWALVALSLSVFSGSVSAQSGGVLGVEFTKREVANPHHPRRLRKRQGTPSATIYNAQTNLLYLINTTVGTPPQPIDLHLDTGSSDIWVPVASSTICQSGRTSRCSSGSYDSSNSNSFTEVLPEQFLISYVDGTRIAGDYINETFGIAGASVFQMTMGTANQAEEPGADELTPFQGILGVGFDTGEAIYAQSGGQIIYPNIISQMVLQGVISTRAYSLWLNDLESPTGNILFGGVDNSKYEGDLTILPLQSDAQTNIIDSFTVTFAGLNITGNGGSTVYSTQTTVPVILDSGTTLTYLPDDIANAIAEGVGAVTNYNYGTVVPCDLASTQGQFYFQFGNSNDGPVIRAEISQFVLPFPSDIAAPQFSTGQTACRWGILPSGSDPNLFGDTFLRSAYVVYNIEGNEVGIAQTTFNSTTEEILQITAASELPGASSTASGQAQQTRTGPLFNTDDVFGGLFGSGSSTAAPSAGSGTFDLGTATASNGGGIGGSSSSTSTPGAAAGLVAPSTPFMGALFAGITVLFAMVGGSILVLA